MATLAEQMVGSERLERRLDDIVQVEIKPWKACANWMGTEMTNIHDDLWSAFLKDSFRMLMNAQERSKGLRQLQAPGPSTQTPVLR